jgi:hypothetical protein
LEGGFGLWLGDKGIVNGKMSTHLSYSNRLWAHTSFIHLTTGRKHNRKDIELVEELLLGFLAGAITIALQLGLLAGAVAETLVLSMRHLK